MKTDTFIGDLLTLTDGKSQVTSWNYDSFGRQTNKIDAASNILFVYKYDPNNRLTNRWSIAKGSTIYSYDNGGNLTGITYPVSPSISLAYDALNRLTNMVDASGTTKYSYDTVGQILSEDGPWASDTVSYSYANRLRATLRLSQPNASPWSQSYGYDSAKRLTTLTSPAGTFSYSYDSQHPTLVSKLSLPNGAYITNSFDSLTRLLSTVLKNSTNGVLNSHSYVYDPGNQRTQQVFTAGNYVDYTYDPIGQLKTATGREPGGTTNRLHEQLSYGYDAAGNLNWRTNNALVQTFNVNTLNELTTITRNATNALTVAGTTISPATNVTVNSLAAALYNDSTFAKDNFTITNGNNTFIAVAKDSRGRQDTQTITVNLPTTNTFVYDLNGNLLMDGNRGFAYDDENQLIAVYVTNAWRSEFTYDGKFRRRKRKEFTWTGSIWSQTNEVRYLYDGNVVIQERDTNNLPAVSYTRSGLSLLARTECFNLQPSTSHAYYHADGNLNLTALINSNQALVAKYSYDPFGNTLLKNGPLAEANVYQFSSQELHRNSDLVVFLHRFYDPALQRWITRDPIEERGGLNLYAYVRNNTLSFLKVSVFTFYSGYTAVAEIIS